MPAATQPRMASSEAQLHDARRGDALDGQQQLDALAVAAALAEGQEGLLAEPLRRGECAQRRAADQHQGFAQDTGQGLQPRLAVAGR